MYRPSFLASYLDNRLCPHRADTCTMHGQDVRQGVC